MAAMALMTWLFDATRSMFYLVSPYELALEDGDEIPQYSEFNAVLASSGD